VVAGQWIVVGSGLARAIAQVIDVREDGLVHVRPLRGPVTRQRLAELIERSWTAPPRTAILRAIDREIGSDRLPRWQAV